MLSINLLITDLNRINIDKPLTSHRPLWSYGFDKGIISMGSMVKGNETHSFGVEELGNA